MHQQARGEVQQRVGREAWRYLSNKHGPTGSIHSPFASDNVHSAIFAMKRTDLLKGRPEFESQQGEPCAVGSCSCCRDESRGFRAAAIYVWLQQAFTWRSQHQLKTGYCGRESAIEGGLRVQFSREELYPLVEVAR